MLIQEIIDSIQEHLNRGVASDDKRYPDPFIYSQIRGIRARLLKNKKDKFQDISPFSFQTLECFPLEWTTLYDCPCYNQDCKFLVSKYEIPEILSYRNDLIIDLIATLGGKKIDRISIPEISYMKDSRTRQNALGWFIHKNKLVIVGDSKLRVVTVRAVFSDPLKVAEVPVCDDCGEETGNTCYTPESEKFPIDEEMLDDLEKMVIEKIKKMAETSVQDNENNAKAREQTGRE